MRRRADDGKAPGRYSGALSPGGSNGTLPSLLRVVCAVA
jgi:hypothetical protein